MSAYSDAILSDNPVIYYRLNDTLPIIAQDTFAARTVSGSFGNASDGEAYQVLVNTHAVVGVDSGEGTIYYDNAGAGFCSYSVLLGTQSVVNATYLIRFNFLSLSGGPEMYLYARYIDGNNWYRVRIASSTVYLQSNVSGSTTTTTLGSFSISASTAYFFRLTMNGSAFFVTIWQSGTLEPATPTFTITDTSIVSAGQFGFLVIAIGTSITTGVTIDSYSVASGLTTSDSSGNQYDGTIIGTATVQQPGAIAYDTDTAIYFSGTPGAILLPLGIAPQTWAIRSMELWLKRVGVYEHIVLTYNGTTIVTYLNGMVYTGGGVGDQVLIANDLSFVGTSASGTLDEVAYYNQTLTAAQVAWRYRMGLYDRSGMTVFPAIARRSGDFPETQRRGGSA